MKKNYYSVSSGTGNDPNFLGYIGIPLEKWLHPVSRLSNRESCIDWLVYKDLKALNNK